MSHRKSHINMTMSDQHAMPYLSGSVKQNDMSYEVYPFDDSSPELVLCPQPNLPSTGEAPMLSRWANQLSLNNYVAPDGLGGFSPGAPMLSMSPYTEFTHSPPSTDGPSSPGSLMPPPSPSPSSNVVDDNHLGVFNNYYIPTSGPTSSPAATSQQQSCMVHFARGPRSYPDVQPASGEPLYFSNSLNIINPINALGTGNSSGDEPDVQAHAYHLKLEHEQSPDLSVVEQSPKKATRAALKKKEATIPCPFEFAGCQTKFKAKNEWKRHVNKIHIEPEYWACSRRLCRNKSRKERYFNRDDLFKTHYKRMHLSLKSEANNECKTAQDHEAVTATQNARRLRRITYPHIMKCPVRECPDQFHGDKMLDRILEHLFKHYMDARDCNSEPPLVGGHCSPEFTEWAAQNEFIVPCESGQWRYVRAVERTQAESTVDEDVDAEGEDEY